MRNHFLVLPLVLGTALSAQSTPVTGGFIAGFNVPTGDFATTKDGNNGDYLGANNGLGAQIGGFLAFDLDRHNQIRLHLTYNGFASDDQDIYDNNGYYAGTRHNTFSITQVGGDYIYNAVSPTRGGYFLAGLNLNYVDAQAEYSDYPDVEVSQSGRPGARIGGGYHFSRAFSVEGLLNTVSVDDNVFGFSNITWLSVNAVFRFGR